ncbi:MAG: hypothetical protein AMS26_22695 [Bacteroides sp. SM23_62]|nr:MAG: hypothetical protein AMS26_22695 [Bacteroides sp. SM23_62]
MTRIIIIFILLNLIGACDRHSERKSEAGNAFFPKKIILDFSAKTNAIDGFGVNITPAQWNDGNLKPVIDLLVDDLGCTLFRFDCYGRADWLDPGKQLPDRSFPEDYLSEVYTGKTFTDAWETFRYLNAKGVEPIFNISGRIPAEWAGPDGERLVDFESYAEMAVSLLKWARYNEHLEFSLFMPYNETNLGFPEGPYMEPVDCVPSVKEIIKRLNQNGLEDIKLIVMGDSHVEIENIRAFLDDASMINHIYGFSGHTYGNGYEEDARNPWPWGDSPFKKIVEMIDQSEYKGKPLWITEYGDLDQTGEIEFEFAWRSTRRLIRLLNDGVTAALAWDAFDNFHEHDGQWALYGLLKTDSLNWTYQPKKRYFAAKNIYKYVKPGFSSLEIEPYIADPDHVYARWQDPFKNIEISAFVSNDGKDLTIVGMSNVEGDVKLTVELESFASELSNRKIFHFRTDRNEDLKALDPLPIEHDQFTATIRGEGIFTLTTIQ